MPRCTVSRLLFVTTAVACSFALSSVHASIADASRKGSGELDHGTLGVEIEVSQRAQPGTDPGPGDSQSSSGRALVRYLWTALPGGPLGSLEGVCNAGGTPATAAQPVFGWLYRVQTVTRDGDVISDTLECVAYPDPNDRSTVPPPPVPATPPTVGDVWRAIALPRPTVGVNPVSRGVTGLDTEMWSGGGQTAQVAVTIGSFRVVGTARVVEYRFATDEGAVGSSPSTGNATSPAAAHRFARKGAHSLSVSSVWQATVTMVGPGGAAPVPIDIDLAVLTATVAYPVVEVRTHLVG
jgi:hypothetical protein